MKKNQLFKTLSILGIATTFFYSCSSDDKIVVNSFPAAFAVSNGTLTDNTATIFWTAAADADGDTVGYTVNLEGTAVTSEISELRYSFTGLTAATNYTGTVVASDGKGGSTSAVFSFTTIAAPTATNYDITSILSKFDGIDAVSYSVSGNTVTFITTDLPNHTSPYWDTSHSLYEAYNGTNSNWNQNPNSIGEQNITFTMPLNPAEATLKSATPLGPIGISRNGIVFFNQYAGPNNQALTNEIASFDQWLGHPTGGALYHYHIEPTFLTDSFGKEAFLGLLSDGFPVYGPLENGTTITNADLDDCHGHTSVTVDFPEGIYHYHITNEDPYLNGSGFFGSAGTITR
jgi:hypothetical protein